MWSKQQEWRHTPRGYASRFIERAKLETPDTDLTHEWIVNRLSSGVCELSGVNFDWINKTEYYHNPNAPSIDRIDSSKGYYKDNVQFILSWLNRAKGEFSMDTFLTLINSTWKALLEN